MDKTAQIKYLKIALMLIGLTFIVGIYPLTIIWPAGWAWHVGGVSPYLQMIVGIYATLGVFLILAARDPHQHLSLIWFTIWSSIIHASIMMIQSIIYPEHMGHLIGDVTALFLIAAILFILIPKRR